MRTRVLGWCTIGLAVSLCGAAPTPSPARAGASLYREHCAACHGAEGRGDGPRSHSTTFAPPDLTAIARHNGGRFPRERIVRIVEGRRRVRGHDAREMPIWSDVLKDRRDGYSEARARERVQAVVDFLETLQETPPR